MRPPLPQEEKEKKGLRKCREQSFSFVIFRREDDDIARDENMSSHDTDIMDVARSCEGDGP